MASRMRIRLRESTRQKVISFDEERVFVESFYNRGNFRCFRPRKTASVPLIPFVIEWKLACSSNLPKVSTRSLQSRGRDSMSKKNTAVFGIYRDRRHAEEAVDCPCAPPAFETATFRYCFPTMWERRTSPHEKNIERCRKGRRPAPPRAV